MIRRVLISIAASAAVLWAGAAVAANEAPASTASSAGGPACISDTAKNTLAACENKGPASFNVGSHGKAPQVNFHSAPPPADLKKRDMQKAPSMPTESLMRDERKGRLQARARALLVTEIQGLENLFHTTPQNAPDRVQLARRLAEDYVELESAAFREKTQAEIDRDALKKTNPAAAGQKQTIANQANRIMLSARQRVIGNSAGSGRPIRPAVAPPQHSGALALPVPGPATPAAWRGAPWPWVTKVPLAGVVSR